MLAYSWMVNIGQLTYPLAKLSELGLKFTILVAVGLNVKSN